MSNLRTCPVKDCPEQHDRKMLMCRSHWFQVPKPLRDELWASYREGIGERYLNAREACMEAVEP